MCVWPLVGVAALRGGNGVFCAAYAGSYGRAATGGDGRAGDLLLEERLLPILHGQSSHVRAVRTPSSSEIRS